MNTLMKTTAFAAAIAMGSTAALANNSFGFQTIVSDDDAIELDLINSVADGFVVIYDYDGGEFGDMLGQVAVNAGANDDVIIPLDPAATVSQIAAVLYAGPITTPMEADAWIELDVKDDS